MADEIKQFFRRIQLKPAIVAGHVANVTVDPGTGQQLSALVTVGNNTIRVRLDPNTAPLANGDQVRLEQYGHSATAEYKLAGIEAGGRPNSGTFPVLNDGTSLGGSTYAGGDLIIGKLDEGNLFAEYATGRLYHRIGASVYGIDYPDGARLFGHAVKATDWVADGPNVYIDATSVLLRTGTVPAITLDTTGTVWAGRLLRAGTGNTTVALDAADATWRLYAGSATPGSAPFRVDKTGALVATNAQITGQITATSGSFTGAITAGSGSIGGWAIGSTALTGGAATLSSAGYLTLGTGNDLARLDAADATYRLWIGNAIAASAPFRVTKAGAITATAGAIGGWTIATGTLSAGDLALDAANTRIQCGASASSYVRITPSGIVGVSAGLGVTFNLPSDGSAPTFASGVINSTVFNITSSGILRTSETVGDGSANGYGVLINSAGVKGFKASDATPVFYLNATDGSLTCTNANITGIVNITGGNAATQGYADQAEADAKTAAQGYANTAEANAKAASVPTGGAASDVNNNSTTISGGKITTGTITANQLSATAIDGKTITGSVIRTAASGARVELNTAKIFGTDGTTEQWYASTSDGKLYAGGGKVKIDANGVSLDQSSSLVAGSALKWYSATYRTYTVDATYNLGGQIYGYNGGDGGSSLVLKSNAQKYYYPGYGWLSSGAGVKLWARDEVAASPVSVALDLDTSATDGTHTIVMSPGASKGIKVDGLLTCNSSLNVVRNSATYAGKVLIAKGTTYNPSVDLLTTTYQDILSVTQTVPAGVLVVSGTIQFQVQSNNGLCECNAALIVDGTQHMWNQEVRNYQWAIGIIPINWCGDVAAGTRTWKLQAKYKDGTHTVYAMVQSYLSWQYYA